ncbi:transcription factor IIIB 90 kDa subunit isoform X1 [Hydra vulgaris]|nr:transcription factor IIIB 90 kDa subunit [Hydra vulgaris]
MGISCKNCGGIEIDNDPARGDSVCVSCGSVVESLCIVNDIEFHENSAGSSSVIGQFVSSEGQNRVGSYSKFGVGQDHRQVALENGKQLINNYGGQIKMSHHCLDSAYMFFKMAASKRFTVGRKTIYVVGACLYLVSRTEKTPHMLLDICDAIQCDIVVLGRVFLALARTLCIDCPIVDPSLYIHRFAHQLDFGDKENEVSMAALRILARMKKDWIHLGRRPSALCGAALIIAGKLFNFNVTMDDIVKLVRMSKTTVFKRLMDFSKTATGKLTTDEFKRVDLEEEADPPCYTYGKKRIQFAQEIDKKHNFVSSYLLSQVVKTQRRLEVLLEKRHNINSEIEKVLPESKAFVYQKQLPSYCSLHKYELDEKGEFKVPHFVIHEEPDDILKEEVKTVASNTLLLDQCVTKVEDMSTKSGECNLVSAKSEKNIGDINCDEIDLEGIDDEEIEELLLTEDEIKIKTEIWLEENKEYLQKMKEKEEDLRMKEEEENKLGNKKKKKARKKPRDRPIAGTADEAIQTMLAEKKISSKINYDVLRGLKSETVDECHQVSKPETISVGDNFDIKPQLLSAVADSEKRLLSKDMPIVYETGLQRNKTSFTSSLESIHSASKRIKLEVKSDETEKKEILEEFAGEEEEDDEPEDLVTASSIFAKEVDDYDHNAYDEDADAFY